MIDTVLLNTSYNNEIILLFQTPFYSIAHLEMLTWCCFISLHHSCSGQAAEVPTMHSQWEGILTNSATAELICAISLPIFQQKSD